MNSQLLIDSIVRQTTVLIGQLATAGGIRAPLAHVANQVFVDLAGEIEAQGVSRKVTADMFGMALRAYQRKIQRLGESTTDRGQSLWEAVYGYLRERDVVTRDEVLERFNRDDEALVRGVLRDLTDSGLVFTTGAARAFRAADDDELARLRNEEVDTLVWAIVYREGPIGMAELKRQIRSPQLTAALNRLREEGCVVRDGDTYRSTRFLVRVDARKGWEAAVYDHFHSVVKTICTRLAGDAAEDLVGGSTYTFEVWDGHPLQDEVLGALTRFRQEHSELRKRVRAHNENHTAPASVRRVIVYGGQCVTEEEGPR